VKPAESQGAHWARIARSVWERPRNAMLGSVRRVATTEPVVALTFDDGPHPVFTPLLLDVLARHGASATFFVLGAHAMAHAAVIRSTAAAGHEIGNHTFDHPSMPLVSRAERVRQVRACAELIAPYGGRLYRHPYDHGSLAASVDVRLLGLDVISYDLHAFDWETRPAEWMAQRLIAKIVPGSIVLLHDAIATPPTPDVAQRAHMIEAVELVLEALTPRWGFVTVSELLKRGRAVRGWYKPPDREFLSRRPNYERYGPQPTATAGRGRVRQRP
jgi:peptidoglycan-N-acetylglucosamine deacetylase